METRKAQLTGGSTFTVSLPKDWANGIDLDTGDTLRLFPRDRTLIIQPVEATDEWTVEVRVDDLSETDLRRTIQALYTTGFTRITLSAPTDLQTHRRVVSSTARKFIGLETLESTGSQVTLQSLLDAATVSVEQSTVQLEQVVRSMHEDAVAAFVTRDADLAEHVIERDDQVDRLYAMISRHFQRSLVNLQETEALELDQADLYDYQTTARQLERVADHAEKIADLATQLDEESPAAFTDDIETAAATAREIVTDAASTILGDAEVDTAHDALDRRDELTTDLEDLERELHERDVTGSHALALTLDSLTRTAEYGGNIAETALRSAARERRL